MSSPKETITLSWSMDGESWSHWAKGRCEQTATAVILEGLKEIRESPAKREKIKERIELIRETRTSPSSSEELGRDAEEPKCKVKIQLPAAVWGDAYCRISQKMMPGTLVKPGDLLAAIIVESNSWQQSGNETDEFLSGWLQDPLAFSLGDSTELTHEKLIFGKQEKIIGWIVAGAAAASAGANWWGLFC